MGLINIRLGDYIERSTINNKDLKYEGDLIVGVLSKMELLCTTQLDWN